MKTLPLLVVGKVFRIWGIKGSIYDHLSKTTFSTITDIFNLIGTFSSSKIFFMEKCFGCTYK